MAATGATTLLARVDGGATTVRTTAGGDLQTQVVGWAVNEGCVASDDVPPTLEVLTPVDGAQIDEEAFTFEMAGTATDDGTGVAVVELTVDGQLTDLVPDLTGRPGEWTIEHTVPAGPHTLGVTAVDFAGNATTTELTVTATVPAPDEVVIDPEVVQPSPTLEASISGWDPVTGILTLSADPATLGIAPGSILTLAPLPLLPDGLFREVTQVRRVGPAWEVETIPAALVDAFRQLQSAAVVTDPGPGAAGTDGLDGPAALGRDFTLDDICSDGSTDPDDDGTTDPDDPPVVKLCAGADGRIEFGFDWQLDIGWEWAGFSSGPRIDYVRAVATADLTVSAFLQATAKKTWEPDPFKVKEFALPRISVAPFVWLTPEIDLNLEIEAKAEAKLRLTADEAGVHLEAGLEGSGDDVDFIGDGSFTDPSVDFPDDWRGVTGARTSA